MDNLLAKKYNFQLNSKSAKILRDKSFVCYNTDTIKFIIEIYEDDDYKELGDSQIEIVYSYPNGETKNPIRQKMEDGGIEIIADSTIEIIPKGNCLIPTEYLRIDINLYDEDEFITLQPFAFKVYKSTEAQEFEDAQDVVVNIDIMRNQISMLSDKAIELNEEIDGYLLENTEKIGLYIEESKEKIEEFVEQSDLKLNEYKEKIDGTTFDLDEYFLRSVVFNPVEENGNIIFESETISGNPMDLIGKTFLMSISGSVYVDTIKTTGIYLLYFIQSTDVVQVGYTILANKAIQKKSIDITPVFDTDTANISIDAETFKIRIKSNILADFKDTAICTLTSNSSIMNML